MDIPEGRVDEAGKMMDSLVGVVFVTDMGNPVNSVVDSGVASLDFGNWRKRQMKRQSVEKLKGTALMTWGEVSCQSR